MMLESCIQRGLPGAGQALVVTPQITFRSQHGGTESKCAAFQCQHKIEELLLLPDFKRPRPFFPRSKGALPILASSRKILHSFSIEAYREGDFGAFELAAAPKAPSRSSTRYTAHGGQALCQVFKVLCKGVLHVTVRDSSSVIAKTSASWLAQNSKKDSKSDPSSSLGAKPVADSIPYLMCGP